MFPNWPSSFATTRLLPPGDEPEVRLERLRVDHDLSNFDSGNALLDRWLRRHAVSAQEMDSVRTFVLMLGPHLVGYFSLTMGSVLRTDAPARLVRGMPGYPIGMVLLARLAIHRTEQGQGLGSRLLAEALRKAVSAGEAAAARLIVVDAVDEQAAGFYKRHGFVSVPDHPLRLFRRMKDVRASLDKADRQGPRSRWRVEPVDG